MYIRTCSSLQVPMLPRYLKICIAGSRFKSLGRGLIPIPTWRRDRDAKVPTLKPVHDPYLCRRSNYCAMGTTLPDYPGMYGSYTESAWAAWAEIGPLLRKISVWFAWSGMHFTHESEGAGAGSRATLSFGDLSEAWVQENNPFSE